MLNEVLTFCFSFVVQLAVCYQVNKTRQTQHVNGITDLPFTDLLSKYRSTTNLKDTCSFNPEHPLLLCLYFYLFVPQCVCVVYMESSPLL